MLYKDYFSHHLKNTILIAMSSFVLFFLTTAVHAAEPTGWGRFSLKEMVDLVIKVVGGVLIPIAVFIVFLVFVYGIVKYFHAANTGSKSMIDAAKNHLLYPVIAIFILFTLWGSVDLLRILFTKGG